MTLVKSYWPFIVGFFLMVFIASWLKAQEKPTKIKFAANFSCGQTRVSDLQGNLDGWLVVADVSSQDDELQMKTQHSQRFYRAEDNKKIADYCLQLHKEFNAERVKEQKRLVKLAQSHRKETKEINDPQGDSGGELKTASR
jgi:hypothetical protein